MCLLPLYALTRRVAGLDDKRHLGVYSQVVLAANYIESEAQKHSKGFCWFLFIFNGTLLVLYTKNAPFSAENVNLCKHNKFLP